jgi:hypothetical protein
MKTLFEYIGCIILSFALASPFYAYVMGWV